MGPIYFPNGYPGNVLKMVNFEMSRRYRESMRTCVHAQSVIYTPQ